MSVATQTSSESGEEVGPRFPRRRSSTQLLDEALINGIPGERDVRAAQVEESEFLSQEGWKEGVGFVFPGRALCLGGGDKLSPDEMVPKGDFHIQVFVKDLMGKSHCLVVDRCEQVAWFKRKVFTKTGIKPSLQRLVYGSKQLEDGMDLSFYGIRGEATIHLLFSLKGGMGGGG